MNSCFGGAHPIDTIETNVWYLTHIIQIRTRIEAMQYHDFRTDSQNASRSYVAA